MGGIRFTSPYEQAGAIALMSELLIPILDLQSCESAGFDEANN